ncbi:phage tail domain-containing protein [Amycolatopsis taiwanensis]|uniref:phage tail domain-containing protein n=1 Tax=Amycolatopsis taiwanensis TaxID=342230 RepID=UPI0004869DBD|nr:phage tail domain-containing protein [Amycolatopsis taiwanensis]
MAHGANTWSLDWLTMSPDEDYRDSQGVQWLVTQEKGFWGSPGTNATFSSRLGRHGAYRSPGWKKQRTITLTGRAYAEDYSVLRQAEANVLGLLSDPTQPRTLTCYSEIGALTAEVHLDDEILCTPLDVISEPGFEFSIQVVAPDPAKYSLEQQVMSSGLPHDTGDDGLDFNQVVLPDTNRGLYFGLGAADDGLVFGTSNATGFMRLTNRGTAPTTPIYTLYGPLTNPTLTAGAATLRFNAVLSEGEFVVIDPAAPSVLLGGTAVRRQLLNPAEFAGFAIPPASASGEPGLLSVGLTHTGPITATGYVTASFRAAWF